MTDNEIISKLNLSSYIKFKNSTYKKIFNEEELNYIQNRFESFKSYKESIYRIKHHIEQQPVCPICGKELIYRKGYNKTCSYSCQNKFRNSIETLNKKVKEKYNVNNVWQSEEIKEKCKQILIQKYGVENISQLPEIKIKKQQTCLKHYGVKAGFHSVKSKITKLQRYNSETYNNIQKQKQTCLEKYGADSIFKVQMFKDKIKQTFNQKYGVNYATQLPKTIINSHSLDAISKCFTTQKRNKTINTSKEEIKSFELIKNIFPDVIYQYMDKIRYPFACDFYIPSLDLFIECQYAMFHNKRPYLGNEDDLKEIEIIKEKAEKRKQITGKNKSRYDALIEIWTKHDVLKRNTAKQNHLNYLEFFTILELENWLKTYEAESKHYGENNI